MGYVPGILRLHLAPLADLVPGRIGDERKVNVSEMLTMSRRNFFIALAGMLGVRRAMAAARAFPADFVWGASTASYQIEGAASEDGRGQSIWDVFSHTPGRVKNGDTGDVACDQYHRWREDLGLVADGGFKAYRFSTAWPRIMPAGAGAVEPRGLDFYDRLVDGVIARGVTPYLCLYHWDLPQALQDDGGWVERDTAEKFADYARVVARRLGDRVKHWAMFNEPNVHALFGYGVGSHAPGVSGLPNLLAAIHHQNLAQGRALQALRAERADFKLGTVLSLQPAHPSSDSDADHRAAALFAAYWNDAFLEPLMEGRYPDVIAERFAPLIAAGDLAAIKHNVDFLGVNYYAPAYIADAPGSLFGAWFGGVPAGTRFTAMNWPIMPDGLYEQLMSLHGRYPDLDIYITENGACFDDTVAADGSVNDADRVCVPARPPRRREPRPRRRCQAARLFRVVAVGQFRMGGRLQPPVRRGPCRLRDAEAHAEGLVCVPVQPRQGNVTAAVRPRSSLHFQRAARALVNERGVGEIRPAQTRIGVCSVGGRIDRADRRPDLGTDRAEARPDMQHPRAALGGKARVGPVCAAEAVLSTTQYSATYCGQNAASARLAPGTVAAIAAVTLRSARIAVRKRKIIMCMPPVWRDCLEHPNMTIPQSIREYNIYASLSFRRGPTAGNR